MASRTDTFDLARLQLRAGEGRRLELEVVLEPLTFGTETYIVEPSPVTAVLDVSRMVGGGYSLRLRFAAAVDGPCMRCLTPAAPRFEVDAREVDQPGGGDELSSPYVEGELLDLHAWAHDAFALTLPQQVLCRPDCAGLCPECGADLNADPDHAHERAPDPRWAALRELKLDG
ncbi:DUF177 domain-containing protein [Conexibacter sp. SYSU D00693]|uniref:YceD family protein n=1 Tax=Conexibacter sp. SYSU D00693 TaxID=2812560 RepID=UPI00196B9C50|nr:DUF177 domain-containing protein [Conexibacter sp. SYSU D00693]